MAVEKKKLRTVQGEPFSFLLPDVTLHISHINRPEVTLKVF